MFRLLLFTALCATPLLAADCTDTVFTSGTRDIGCDSIELKSGGDLTPNIGPGDHLSQINLWLNQVTGEIDKTSFPNLRDLISSFNVLSCDFSNFVLPRMPNLKALSICNWTHPEITAESLKFAKNVESLNLRNVEGFDLEKKPLKFLHKLKTISFRGQHIPHLSKESLQGLEDLEGLSLYNSNLEKLDENTFEERTKIVELCLSEHTLKKIEPNTFKPLKKLQSLDISGLSLDEFSLDLLSEQHELTDLGLPTKWLLEIGAKKLKEKFPKLKVIIVLGEDEETKKKLTEKFAEEKIEVEISQ